MSIGRPVGASERRQYEDYLQSLKVQVTAAKSMFRQYGYNPNPTLITMLSVFRRNQHYRLPAEILDEIGGYHRSQSLFPSHQFPYRPIDKLTVDGLIELFDSQKIKGLPSVIEDFPVLISALIHPLTGVIPSAMKDGTLAEFLSTDILFCKNNGKTASQWFFLKPLGLIWMLGYYYDGAINVLLDAYRTLGEKEGATLFRKHYDEWFERKSAVAAQLDTIDRMQPAIALLDQSAESGALDAATFKALVRDICDEEHHKRALVCGGFHMESKIIQILKEIRSDRALRWNKEALALFDAMTVEVLRSSHSVMPLCHKFTMPMEWEALCQYTAKNGENVREEIDAAYESTCEMQQIIMQLRETAFSKDEVKMSSPCRPS